MHIFIIIVNLRSSYHTKKTTTTTKICEIQEVACFKWIYFSHHKIGKLTYFY
jgi:hypothetical protein